MEITIGGIVKDEGYYDGVVLPIGGDSTSVVCLEANTSGVYLLVKPIVILDRIGEIREGYFNRVKGRFSYVKIKGIEEVKKLTNVIPSGLLFIPPNGVVKLIYEVERNEFFKDYPEDIAWRELLKKVKIDPELIWGSVKVFTKWL
jgi:hypothetical protein